MKEERFKFFVALLLVGGYTCLAFSWNNKTEGHSLCVIKNITGYACPSCGTTRSVIFMAHGEIIKALQTNPLGLIAGVFLLLAPFWLFFDFIKRKNAAWAAYRWAEKKIESNSLISVSFIVLITANWVWNIFKNL